MASISDPALLGLKPSLGLGDALGLAGPGHAAALKGSTLGFFPALETLRDMTLLKRTPEAVIHAARDALAAEKYPRAWGADANGLSSEDDIKLCAAAGYTYFTLSLSDLIEAKADQLSEDELEAAHATLLHSGDFAPDWEKRYSGREWEVHEELSLSLDDEALKRAAVKFAPVLSKVKQCQLWLTRHCAQRPFELELDLHAMSTPLNTQEHLFLSLELKRRGVILVSLAPPPPMTPTEEPEEDQERPSALDSFIRDHSAIARKMGPYKLAFYQITGAPELYPALSRHCPDLFHLKLTHFSTLIALQLTSVKNPALFRSILAHPGYEYAPGPEDTPPLSALPESEWTSLFTPPKAKALVCHLLDVLMAQGAVPGEQPIQAALVETLTAHAKAYREAIAGALETVLDALAPQEEK